MRRKIIELLLIFICLCLQSSLFKAVSLGGVSPNLLIILTSAFGFMNGKEEGMYVGFISGLFTDMLYGNGLLGFYTLLYVYIGYANGMFSRVIFPEDVKFPILFIGLSDLIYGLLSYIFLFLLRSRLDLPYYFIRIILPEAVYTILITLLFYRPLLHLEETIEMYEDRESF